MDRLEGYYWCKRQGKWDVFYFCDNWFESTTYVYKEDELDEIDERIITRE